MGRGKRKIDELTRRIEEENDAEGDPLPSFSKAVPLSEGEANTVNMEGPDSFEIVHLIGKGDVGRVYLVKHKATGLPYAMKAMSKEEMVKRKKVTRRAESRRCLPSNKPRRSNVSLQNERSLSQQTTLSL